MPRPWTRHVLISGIILPLDTWRGRVVWLSAHAWKACNPQRFAGSNPALSAHAGNTVVSTGTAVFLCPKRSYQFSDGHLPPLPLRTRKITGCTTDRITRLTESSRLVLLHLHPTFRASIWIGPCSSNCPYLWCH
jgi:hypothetical protein